MVTLLKIKKKAFEKSENLEKRIHVSQDLSKILTEN